MRNVIIDSAANWAWGSSPTPQVNPDYCLEILPSIPGKCKTQLIAKIMGIAIILGASLNQAPIFFNILKTKSTVGLSIGASYGNVIFFTNAILYGVLQKNPITSWGENGVLGLQCLAIVILVWTFKKKPPIKSQQKMLVSVIFILYVVCVLATLPENLQYLLPVANLPLMIYTSSDQIIETYKLKTTGNLSIFTAGTNLIGVLIRLFTTIEEVGWDFNLLSLCAISICFKSTMLAQFYLYWNATDEAKEVLKGKKEN